jgi:hypothetical protein
MVASNIRVQSALNFLMDRILICRCRSQISELCHTSNGSISYLHITIFPCILTTRRQHTVSFLCICLLPILTSGLNPSMRVLANVFFEEMGSNICNVYLTDICLKRRNVRVPSISGKQVLYCIRNSVKSTFAMRPLIRGMVDPTCGPGR